MNKIKIIMIMLVMLMISSLVMASTVYEQDELIDISVQYTEGGVLTHANANLTITLPDGSVDLNANNIGLNETVSGYFVDTYLTTNQTGTYTGLVIFYDDDWIELGRNTQQFEVSAEEELNLFFWPALIICLFLIGLGFGFKQGLVTIIGGIGLIFVSFMMTGAFFIITIIAGSLISLAGLLVEE